MNKTPGSGKKDPFEEELLEMWQESRCAAADGRDEQALKIAEWIRRFDRKTFVRNVAEYAAVAIVLVRSVFEFTSGERPLIASLSSVAAGLFIASYIWRAHRYAAPLNPSTNAKEFQQAMISRLDRQISLRRTLRYWYALPVWLCFLVIYVAGIVNAYNAPVGGRSVNTTLVFLSAEFLLGTAVCLLVIWLNERFGVRRLEKEKERVSGFAADISEEGAL